MIGEGTRATRGGLSDWRRQSLCFLREVRTCFSGTETCSSVEPFQRDCSHPKLCVFGDTHLRLKQHPEELTSVSFYASACNTERHTIYSVFLGMTH